MLESAFLVLWHMYYIDKIEWQHHGEHDDGN